MNGYELVRMLRKVLEDKKTEQIDALAAGAATDFAAYRERVGYIRGISRCNDWLDDAVKTLNNAYSERAPI